MEMIRYPDRSDDMKQNEFYSEVISEGNGMRQGMQRGITKVCGE